MTTLPPAGELLLQRFADTFKELSDLSFFPETDPAAVEFAVGRDRRTRWENDRAQTPCDQLAWNNAGVG